MHSCVCAFFVLKFSGKKNSIVLFCCIDDETFKPRQEVKPTTPLTHSLSLAFFLMLSVLREANMRVGRYT
jgi:hypothetical protein